MIETNLYTRGVRSPLGILQLVADDDALVRIVLPDERAARPARHDAPDHPVLRHAAEELEAYFAGVRAPRLFTVPIRAAGTPFQHDVWSALRTIPYGTTWSYGQLARAVGRPNASRAVGAANARNPIPIIVPCHRVIGASGALVGFGGGLAAKAQLLALERVAS